MKIFYVLFLPLFLTSCIPKSEQTHDTLPVVELSELFNLDEARYYAYFFSEHCRHCLNIRDEVDDFAYSSDIPFYKFDIDENEIPIRSGRDNLIGVSSLEDFYIVGTPSLFLLKEGKIDTYYLGEKEIVEYIQSAK